MGYVDFNGLRYYDIRELPQIACKVHDVANSLESDAGKRPDSIMMVLGDVEQAQENKDRLEEAQRHDRKLREEAEQRRAAGGRKYKSIF